MGVDQTRPSEELVSGYRIRVDLSYDPLSRTWIEQRPDGRVRIGMDPLEVEASGTIAALTLVPPGSVVARGGEIGSLEAEKFVGPLKSPLSGKVEAVNDHVLAQPSEVDRDPYAAWLVELHPTSEGGEASWLVTGRERVREWFEEQVREYRLKGVLAE